MGKAEQSFKLAIIVSTENDWGRRIIDGILSYTNKNGSWRIWIDERTPRFASRLPESWNGDGIIARVATPELAHEVSKSGLPIINISDFDVDGFSAPSIRTDDRAGSALALQHFKEKGIQQFAFVGPSANPNSVSYSRIIEAETAKSKLPFFKFMLDESENNYRDKFIEWLLELPKPTGILVWGNYFARETISFCIDAEISIPEKIAILCADHNELLSNSCAPSLSGMVTPAKQIGYQAAETLHTILLGQPKQNTTTYIAPSKLIEQKSTDRQTVNDAELLAAAKYIEENALSPITMEDILSSVPISRRSLERRFTKAFGRSPNQEVKRIRIAKAKALLTETDLPIKMIATMCGVATPNYLTHIFKDATGYTPHAFRKEYRS